MALPIKTRPERAVVARSEPLAPFQDWSRQLPSFFDYFRQLPSLLEDAFTPLADIEETHDAYLVEVELPGVDKGDIDIELAGRRLTVSGERKAKERVGILRKRERVVGKFRYDVTLPGGVEAEGVEANLDGGILTVRVPKPAAERARRIEVR